MRSLVTVILSVLLLSCNKVTDTLIPQSGNWVDTVYPIVSEKKMQLIDAGSYKTFFGKDSGSFVQVKSFYLDETPVTNKEYLSFLKKNPQWTRSQVLRLLADTGYLHNWQGDYEMPANAAPDAPVTNISWYAARAYAKSVGKRLPTIDEWEFVGAADQVSKNASDKPEFVDYIVKSLLKRMMYLKPVKQEAANFYGIYDMYGMVWEWTEDFSAVMITGDSRDDKNANEGLFCAGSAATTQDLKNYAAFARFAMRGSVRANYCINNLGFRCAKNIVE